MKRLKLLYAELRKRPWVLAATIVTACLIIFGGGFILARLTVEAPDQGKIDKSLKGVAQPDHALQPTKPPITTKTSSGGTRAHNRAVEGPCWNFYGRTAGRTSDAADLLHGKPRKRLWTIRVGMMEFPPSFCDGVLYVNSQTGFTSAIDSITRRVIWRRRTAKVFDSTPAVTSLRIFVGSYKPGLIMALDRRTGKTLWKLKTGGGVESSPVVVNGIVYAASSDHRIYALDEATGRVRWAFRTDGAIKDSPSVANGLVYFANYAAEVYALDARTGKVRWRRHFGGVLGDRIYSSVCVRGSNAWLATVRGDIYSLNAKTGSTRWHESIPGYVYSTPAVSGDRVFIGNYPGHVFAFNANNGKRLWSHNVGGSISGSPTVIGSLVYVSSISAKKTVGLSVKSGHKLWQIREGRYVSGIATDRAIYLSLGPLLSRWSTDRTLKVVRAVKSTPQG